MSETNDKPANLDFDAVIVGAGIAGLYELNRLREMGLKVRSYDAASDVGGTWYWNRYPGARVDSQSYIYQYWFSDELLQEWDWSQRFPGQEETERYLNFVADKFDLRKNIQFDTRVTSAVWDEDGHFWRISTDKGDSVTAQYFISCTGMLSTPVEPPFPGREQFKGIVAHTARYPQEGIDLKGKKVGVVGTGATGIQVIQTIAKEVGELKVFQRTPQYAVPMRQVDYTDEDRAKWRAKYPELEQHVHRTFAGFDFDAFEPGDWDKMTPEERTAALEEVWADGSLSFWIGSFPELFTDQKVNDEISDFVREKIRARIEDPEVAQKLLPYSYGFGTHRVPLERGFYDAFNQDNVELVDISEQPIERFTEKGLFAAGKEYELDVVILATGFDAGTGALTRMGIVGRDGQSLTDLWSRDIRSTLGLQVAGFPNLFTVAGPLAPSTAFCNMATCLTQQAEWIAETIEWMRAHGKSTIEPTVEKQDAWVQHHDETAEATLMMNTKSWYTGDNIEGKPRRLLSYIGGVHNYRQMCEDIKESEYEGFELA